MMCTLRDCGAFGVAAALFPVAQGADGDREQGCEFRLGEAGFFADFFDVDGRQGAQFGGGVVAFVMGLCVCEARHDFVECCGRGRGQGPGPSGMQLRFALNMENLSFLNHNSCCPTTTNSVPHFSVQGPM